MKTRSVLHALTVLTLALALGGCGDDEPIAKDEQPVASTPKKPFSATLPSEDPSTESASDSVLPYEAVAAPDNSDQQVLPPPG